MAKQAAKQAAEQAEHEHHGPSLATYLTIFASLMVLTGLTVAVAYADLGVLAAPLAVAIAGVKATLVILFFMHVRYETRLIGLFAVSGFVFLGILIVITMGEIRGRKPPGPDPLAPPVVHAVAPPPPSAHR